MNISNKLIGALLCDPNIAEEYKEQLLSSLPDNLPYKGYGYIQVDNPVKAEKILKLHVGEFEMEYYPKDFITTEDTLIYIGKFEVERLSVLFKKLLAEKIKIIDFLFKPGTYDLDFGDF